MTVASVYTPAQYQGNGATTAFSFPYQWTAASDLVVTVWDEINQVQVSSVLNGGGTYDYTVTGTADATTGEYPTGTVTFNNAPLASYSVTLARAVPPTQGLALTASGPLPAVQIAVALDRNMLAIQDARAAILTTLRTPPQDPPLPFIPDAVARAGLMLGFDANGNPQALTPQGGTYTPAPLGGYSAGSFVSASTVTLAASACGTIVFLTGAGSQSVVLPPTTGLAVGATITLEKLVEGSQANITCPLGAAQIFDIVGNGAETEAVLLAGENVAFTWDGTLWRPQGIMAFRQTWFSNSKTQPGYYQTCGGTEQWGQAALVAGAATIAFPVTFGIGCFAAIVTPTGISGPGTIPALGIGGTNVGGMTVYGPTGSTQTFNWRATGS